MAVFDQDAPAAILMKYPSLYEHGRLDLAYKGKFWPMMLDALYGGTVVFFFTYAAYLLVGMMEEQVGGVYFFFLTSSIPIQQYRAWWWHCGIWHCSILCPCVHRHRCGNADYSNLHVAELGSFGLEVCRNVGTWIMLLTFSFFFSFATSIFILYVFGFIYNGINFTAPLVPDAYWGLMVACTDGRYWLLIILVTWVAVLPKLLIM